MKTTTLCVSEFRNLFNTNVENEMKQKYFELDEKTMYISCCIRTKVLFLAKDAFVYELAMMRLVGCLVAVLGFCKQNRKYKKKKKKRIEILSTII